MTAGILNLDVLIALNLEILLVMVKNLTLGSGIVNLHVSIGTFIEDSNYNKFKKLFTI